MVKPCTIRLIFTLAITHGWDVQQVDVNNAFLHGELQEQVFMPQPTGFVNSQYPSHVCRLNKAIYGLKQAPRAWFDKLKHSLIAWGFQSSKSDTSLFFSRKNGQLLLLIVYVDDILITGGNSSEIKRLISHLHSQFGLKILGSVSYFLGFEVTRDKDCIWLNQRKYTIDLLQRTNMTDSNPMTTPMCPSTKLSLTTGSVFEDPTLYRSTIGALQYLTLNRPDIAFTVNRLSQYLKAPTSAHWSACKRLLRYLAGTASAGLRFTKAKSMELHGYTDADWAGCLDDRRSTSGYCLFLGGNLISWSSKKQAVIARSSTEAEYRGLALATAEVIWLESLLHELSIPLRQPPILWCDNLGAGSLASNPVYHARTKHLEIDLHFVRDRVLAKKLDVRYVSASHQIADILTKALPATPFTDLCSKLTLGYPELNLRGGC